MRNAKVLVPVVLVVALIVVGAAVILPRLNDDKEREARARTSSLEGLEVVEGKLPTTHVTVPVDYDQSPPVGGEHWGVWMDCGFYSDPLPDEFAVHDLEHGSVWFAYDPELPAEDQATLAEALPASGIASPYEGLSSPIVLVAWGRSLAVDDVDDPRIAEFVDTFESAPTAGAENEIGCGGGITYEQIDAAKAELGITTTS